MIKKNYFIQLHLLCPGVEAPTAPDEISTEKVETFVR